MKYLSFFICTLFLINSSQAQDSNSVYQITNQLGYSVSSKTISKGNFFGNLNYSYSELSVPSYGFTYDQWRNGSTLNFGYGITKKWDVSLTTGHNFTRTRYNGWFPESGYNTSGWNGLGLATKLNVTNQKNWRPELAISVESAFTNSFDFQQLDIRIAWSYMLGKKIRLGGNFAFFDNYGTVELDNLIDNFYYTLNARYTVLKGMGVFAELDMPTSIDSYTSNLSFGAFYMMRPNMMLHLKYSSFANFGTYNYMPSASYIGGGFSWLFGKK